MQFIKKEEEEKFRKKNKNKNKNNSYIHKLKNNYLILNEN